MNRTLPFVAATVALVAVTVGGCAQPGAASPTPSPIPSALPIPSPDLSSDGHATRIKVAGSELQFSADLPATWSAFEFGAERDLGTPSGIAFFSSVVDNTFADPCTHAERSPKVGSSIDALAAALGEVPGTTATEPVEATVGGFEAALVELTLPTSLPCVASEFYLWQDSPGNYWWALAPDETVRVWILDVEGQRVAVAARSWPGTTDEAEAELQAILDSISFDE